MGPKTFWTLLRECGDISLAIEKAGRMVKGFALFSKKDAIFEMNQHESMGFQLLFAFADDFPKQLKQLPDCPPVLSVYGNKSALNETCIAIVGARSASLAGKNFAFDTAQVLSHQGIKIISGLARGIDTSAHNGSLSKGTIAVLAGGIDQIYPPENKDLYHAVSKTGCLVSEMPLGVFPGARHFPRRNRLISGLSKGVVIIEAAKGSGSLITARYAVEQNKDIFAVPGFPTDPRSFGANSLIKQGAILIQSPHDILDHLSIPILIEEQIPDKTCQDHLPDALAHEVLKFLSHTPILLDVLLEQLPNHTPQSILSSVQELEILGKIVRHPDQTLSLV